MTTQGPLMDTVLDALHFHRAFHQGRANTIAKGGRGSPALREAHLEQVRIIQAAIDQLTNSPMKGI